MRQDEPFYFDKCGNEIHEGDLLEVEHFRGRRKRKYFMYHIAVIWIDPKTGLKWWQGRGYNKDKAHYNFCAMTKNGVISACRVINRAKWDEDFSITPTKKSRTNERL